MRTLFNEIREKVSTLGGYYNAHIHLDRTGTLRALESICSSNRSDSSLSLSQKHGLIPKIHRSGAYDKETLKARCRFFMDEMVDSGTTRADSVVDVDGDHLQLSAIHALLELKDEYREKIDFKVGSYSPLGFKKPSNDNWNMVKEGAALADFIGLLPERDDDRTYEDHIGYDECCRRGLLLSEGLSKPIHIHVDQANHVSDNGAETVLDVMDDLGIGHASLEEPRVWLIHVISPSVYDAARFSELCHRMADKNIGVVVCPSAAISMRQYRDQLSPTYNSIARVLEFAQAGLHIRLGTDNICDVTSPLGTTDMLMEVFVLANAVRYYDPGFLAKLAAGKPLDSQDRMRIQTHLEEDRIMIESFMKKINS